MVAFRTFTDTRLDAQQAEIEIKCDCDENGDALVSLGIGGPDPTGERDKTIALLTPEEAHALVRALNCVLAGI